MFPRRLILDFDGRRLQGARPFAVFESKNGAWNWTCEADFPFQNGSGDELAEIRRALNWLRAKRSTRGAAMGFFSYDFARQLEPRAFGKNSPRDDLPSDLNVPDVRLVFCDELEISSIPDFPSRPFAPLVSKKISTSEYSDSIARIREYIGAGDIYQANFSTRFSAPLPCSPDELYARLRSTHPAPFSALLEWDDFSIVSNSPERFLKLENGVLTSQPIKGTARRGSTLAEDAAIKMSLQNSPKNRAENVMIVDLIRNDFGRVCEYGSIQVPQLFKIQTFASLHHLVSEVRGVLRKDCDGLDAFGAAFPCGSITGAPKIRAMQIIDELETTRRGASFGAVGYFGFDGNMEWNVAIRTITCKNGMAHFHAGGGIVEGSTADEEYSEMQLKAAALRASLAEENCN